MVNSMNWIREGEMNNNLVRPLVWLKGGQLGLLSLGRVVGKGDKTLKG